MCVSVHLWNRESHGESDQVRDLLSRNGPVSSLEGYKLRSLQHGQAISMYTCGDNRREDDDERFAYNRRGLANI